MTKRILAVIFIYLCTVAAWMILGGSVNTRTRNQDSRLKTQVGRLWGSPQRQKAPLVYYLTEHDVKVETKNNGETITKMKKEYTRNFLPLESSAITVTLNLDYRQKGLLWYSTYRVRFHGKFRVKNSGNPPSQLFVEFAFPNQESVYDDFRFVIGGREIPNIQVTEGKVTQALSLAPGQTEEVEIAYGSQGLDEWWYDFGENVSQVKNFKLSMSTDFDQIDFPENSISPGTKNRASSGWDLQWEYTNLLSGVKIGMAMPKKLNPGPWVSRVIFSAPISLFLFFFLLFLFSALDETKVHPMNYFFLGAAFFSFHLLLAYLVDHISIHLAFAISSSVSILLVITYMRLVTGSRFAFLQTGISQFVYLVLFSYTFFFEEFTGLAVTVLCILTLFVVMQFTGKVDWARISPQTSAVAVSTHSVDCPFCRAPLQDSLVSRCRTCGTLHHESCWNQHGGCGLYGCRSQS